MSGSLALAFLLVIAPIGLRLNVWLAIAALISAVSLALAGVAFSWVTIRRARRQNRHWRAGDGRILAHIGQWLSVSCLLTVVIRSNPRVLSPT